MRPFRHPTSLLTAPLLASSLVACGPLHAPPPPEPLLLRVARAPDAFVREVSRLRSLPARQPIPIEITSDRDFARILLAPGGDDGGEAPTFGVFGLDRAQSGGGKGSRRAVAEAEQVVALYHLKTRKVHVRDVSVADDELTQGVVLAHEVEHALQHQNFDMQGKKPRNDDEAYARLSLIEGDAQAAAMAYLADRRHLPVGRVLTRASEYITNDTSARVAAADARVLARRVRGLSVAETEALLFPYERGLQFAASLHRAGGFVLVDRAFAFPPVSTEQILHPQKYLDGELPIEVPPPPGPEGARRVFDGRMGELMTGLVLARCVEPEAPRPGAEGWAGDAYAIFEKADGKRALSWDTVWDDEASAERFERGVLASASCPSQDGGVDVEGPYQTRRVGKRVIAARGLDRAAAESLFARAMTVQLPAQSFAPPGPRVVIPPIKPKPTAKRGEVGADHFTSPMLGVSAPVPRGWATSFDSKEMLFEAKWGERGAHISLGMIDEPYSPAMRARTADVLEAVLKQIADRRTIVKVGDGPASTPLGKGHAYDWRVQESGARARLFLVPICEGAGAIMVTVVSASDAMQEDIDAFLAGLRSTTSAPPVCDELNP